MKTPRPFFIFPGSHLHPNGNLKPDSSPIELPLGQWEMLGWITSAFHAGPRNLTKYWEWAIHFTISNLPDPCSGSETQKYPRMFLYKANGDLWDRLPFKPLVCPPLTQRQSWILQL